MASAFRGVFKDIVHLINPISCFDTPALQEKGFPSLSARSVDQNAENCLIGKHSQPL